MKARLFAIAVLAVISASAPAETVISAKETSIPFVSSNGIIDWQAAGDEALYIKAFDGFWYYVRTMGPCRRIKSSDSLGFVTSALDQLDRHGAILAGGQRCPVASVVRSDAPPPKKARG
jgi:hypothetical protein